MTSVFYKVFGLLSIAAICGLGLGVHVLQVPVDSFYPSEVWPSAKQCVCADSTQSIEPINWPVSHFDPQWYPEVGVHDFLDWLPSDPL